MNKYRVVVAEHTCCFESRVEVENTEIPLSDDKYWWDVVAEFCCEEDALEFVKMLESRGKGA